MKASHRLFMAIMLCSSSVQATRFVAVGDSITAGIGASPGRSWPQQLAILSQEEVVQFGVSGASIAGTLPYVSTPEFQAALASANEPDTVVAIMLGTNDIRDWHSAEFKTGLETLTDEFSGLDAKPAIVLILPPWYEAWPSEQAEARSILLEVAVTRSFPTVDVETATEGLSWMFPDGVHPIDEGHSVIARMVFDAILAGSGRPWPTRKHRA